ncbi:AarF/ABC1/UbiB kinase family protein [Micromonospora sp. NPDC050495]|uniref:ABC1 kinase family protein n=1 Tax=Micromonospora sp. NPDC050495 TaxID=3154936 RepID=UPI0033CC2885
MPRTRAVPARMARVCGEVGVAALRLAAARAARRPGALGVELSRLLDRLGGAHLKLGQLLATRVDVIGPELAGALGRLHDRARPMTAEAALTTVRRGFGEVPAFLERALRRPPVASGSVACVYRAESQGRSLAVKVLRPDIGTAMRADLAVVRALARLLQRLPKLRRIPFAEIVDQLGDSLLGQLDFVAEAENLRRLREDLGRVPDVVVPRVVTELSRPGVLTMEFLDGLDTATVHQLPPAVREQEVRTLVQAVYRMLFIEGFIHVDLHQGNTYFRTDGTVAVVDAGFAFRMGEPARRTFTEFFAGMIRGDGETCADILLSTTRGDPSDADIAGFRRDVIRLVTESAGRTAQEFSLVAFSVELFDLQRRRGLFAEPQFVFPLLCLLSLEGTVKRHHPSMNFQLEAAPHVMHGLLDAA